jgi:hypothetical protein
MNDRKMRSWLRWSHIILGLLLTTYLYTPLHLDAQATMWTRLLVTPILLMSGAMMWAQWSWAKFGGRN